MDVYYINILIRSGAQDDLSLELGGWSETTCTLYIRGVARGEHRGHLPPPPFFPESCNIYHKYQHQVVTVVFRVKNDHRKADYKAICKQTFELCLDRAVPGLESRALDEF